MAQVPPFFQHVAHVTGLMAPAPVPERYPFHDNDECPLALKVKSGGQWQYYEPSLITETRPRCPVCAQLGRLEKA